MAARGVGTKVESVRRMVKNGHRGEPVPTEFDNRSRPGAEIEAFRLSDLARRLGHDHAWPIERVGFHLVVLYLRGRTTHMVDLSRHVCRPGSIVRVQPGQVQQLDLRPGVDGIMVMFTASFLFPGRPKAGSLWHERFFEDVSWPTLIPLGRTDSGPVRQWFERLERSYRDLPLSPLSTALLQHLLSVVLLDVAHRAALTSAPAGSVPEDRQRVRQFKIDLERSFRVTRSVGDYARHLGCSTRTLDRACRVALGASAKRVIDARVTLEARRLLVHTTMTVAAIGEALGFTEATNFVKFFKAQTGMLPSATRAGRV